MKFDAFKSNRPGDGLLGLPVQGADLVCAVALHAVVLLCVFGLKAETAPQGHQPVLMADWISAESPRSNPQAATSAHQAALSNIQPNQVQPKPVAPKLEQKSQTINKATPSGQAKPREAEVLSSPSPEAAPAVSEARVEPKTQAKLESQLERKPESQSETRSDAAKPSEFKPSDSKSGDARPMPAAFSPGGKPTLNPDYLAELFRKLARHKVYPAELKKNKIEGRVVVKFTLAADGRVIGSSIQQSSGNESLDEAALQMLNKASPLPAIPSWMNRTEMTLAVPVEYSLLTDR